MISQFRRKDDRAALRRHRGLRPRDGHVGSLPICGPDNRLQGIITDRDIVVKCLAEGRDPKTTTAGDLAQGKPVRVDADADADASDVLRLMEEHQIRRLPVIEERRLVGMISRILRRWQRRGRRSGTDGSIVTGLPLSLVAVPLWADPRNLCGGQVAGHE
jgi:CBS domain